MPFWKRHPAPIDGNTATAAGQPIATDPKHEGHRGHHGHHGNHGGYPVTFNARPTFGQWLKATGLDILTMFILGAIGLGVSIRVRNEKSSPLTLPGLLRQPGSNPVIPSPLPRWRDCVSSILLSASQRDCSNLGCCTSRQSGSHCRLLHCSNSSPQLLGPE
jgi:hypothetical protein